MSDPTKYQYEGKTSELAKRESDGKIKILCPACGKHNCRSLLSMSTEDDLEDEVVFIRHEGCRSVQCYINQIASLKSDNEAKDLEIKGLKAELAKRGRGVIDGKTSDFSQFE